MSGKQLNVLIFCDMGARRIGAIRDHLTAFSKFSRHNIFLIDSPSAILSRKDFADIDVIILHHSIVISIPRYISADLEKQIAEFSGYKIAYVQDEYQWVNDTVESISRLGVDLLYTVLNPDVADRVYAYPEMRRVRRRTTLTGFVSDDLLRFRSPRYESRPIDVGYRARRLPAAVGFTGQEKCRIGTLFEVDAISHGLTSDIEFDESKRIYGRRWLKFVSNCKAMLGAESSISFFDFDGTVIPSVNEYMRLHPAASFETVQQKFLGERDGDIVVRVISPRCFEAAALRTLMIMYDGDYSGILKPWRHYVPLARDHSNMEEVVGIIRDPARAKKIIDCAYEEVAANPKYSYEWMAADFDRDLDQHSCMRDKAPYSKREQRAVARLRRLEKKCARARYKQRLSINRILHYGLVLFVRALNLLPERARKKMVSIGKPIARKLARYLGIVAK
jgi:hypothetical protein